ncbi:iron uptake transporter deferrochelatase/peroxidase subunit [Pseudonocardia sp. N23]|uniref:iron uptake transporter deferrochelatase/peroxidase subunit n=1 Tax=Pseudonocardia sp. N23 TaxID=1987376 RepID=UPI000BFB5CD9|nr:iron uptake transporter deferrochelatase/peroxidase subunit [Pseudonocardia sp. N23]GAY12636.1 ferrous iron transport peroxidase EfeB [Pseudonocardia sp. N23]
MELSRRRLLQGIAGAGAAGAGLALAGCAPSAAAASDIVDFHGPHQAGIATPVQDRLAFTAFDVASTARREDLVAMLTTWTAAAEAMTRGAPVPGATPSDALPPADTGEADGLPAGRLTITVGFGPGLFTAADGTDRFGLASRRPAAFAPLPALPGELLDDARSGGDIAVQACSDDPTVAFHAVRNLTRLGRGTVVARWAELGFGKTSSTGSAGGTPRNLMGFKDGTRNIQGTDDAALGQHVWVADGDGAGWLGGGSYLVARRIRMFIEPWDRDRLSDQEAVFGRFKASGAPLTGKDEFDTPDFTAVDASGPVIADHAHVRLAAAENNGGLRILRRGYSYTDGIDARTGTLDAGLFFLAYMRDPAQFVTLQRKLGSGDALNEYIRHVGSGLYACPPGTAGPDDWWGRTLFL